MTDQEFGALRRARLLARLDEVAPRWLSLDVFDTLLVRPFSRPVDVFVEIHRTLTRREHAVGVDARTFARLRIEAEATARRLRPADAEARIEEIAAELAHRLGGRVPAQTLVDAEVATESALIELNMDVAKLVLAAEERGIPYVLVSDMYLRAKHIVRLLHAAAAAALVELPAPAHVFVSGERRMNKSGRLFDEVLRVLGAEAHEVLHVGDHPHADVQAPKLRGVHVEHAFRDNAVLMGVLEREQRYLPPDVRNHHYDLGLRTHRLRATTSALGRPHAPFEHFHYGAFVLGPVFTLFAEWIVDDCVRRGENRVYCLMREGRLLAPLVDAAARAAGVDLETRPLWASRYALRGVSFHEVTEPELRAYLAKRHALRLSAVAHDLGVDEGKLRTGTRVMHDEPMSREEQSAVIAVLIGTKDLSTQVLAESARKRERYFRYLRAEGVLDRERFTVVDLGWAGTMQLRLAHAFEDLTHPPHIRGLYLATHDRLLRLPKDRCSASSFLYHLGIPSETWPILKRSPELLELSCSAREGSLKEIDEDGNPVTFPQVLPAKQLHEIEEIQRGIHHFANSWLTGASRRRAGLPPSEAETLPARLRAIVNRAVNEPTMEEVLLFEGWQHDENDGSLANENVIGDAALRERARSMSYEEITAVTWLESYWPAALARLVDKTPRGGPPVAEPAQGVLGRLVTRFGPWLRFRRTSI